MDYSSLIAAGLAQNEAKAYVALLKIGAASVAEIAREAKIHRVNTYDVLERLKEKGLVSTVARTEKQLYEPSNPEALLQLLERREEVVKQALPGLLMDYKLRKNKETVSYLKGPEGVATAYNLMLDQRETIYGIGGSGLTRKTLKHRYEQWDRYRKQLGIRIKALYYESARKKNIGKELWEIKYLPDEFQNPLMIDICGNFTVMLLNTEEVMAIVIENHHLANAYRKHFDLLWSIGKA